MTRMFTNLGIEFCDMSVSRAPGGRLFPRHELDIRAAIVKAAYRPGARRRNDKARPCVAKSVGCAHISARAAKDRGACQGGLHD